MTAGVALRKRRGILGLILALGAAFALALGAPLAANAVGFDPAPASSYGDGDPVSIHLDDLVSTGVYQAGICANIMSPVPDCNTNPGEFDTLTHPGTSEDDVEFLAAKEFTSTHGEDEVEITCMEDAEDTDNDQCYILVFDHTSTDTTPLIYQAVYITP